VLLDQHDGTFLPGETLVTGVAPSFVTKVPNFTTGRQELVVANSGSNTVSRFGGSTGTREDFPVGTTPVSVAVSNGSNLAVANSGANTVSVLLGNGDGTFPAAPFYRVGLSPQSVAVGDFNGDGKRDLAVANAGSNTVSVLLGNGDGAFQEAQAFAAGSGP